MLARCTRCVGQVSQCVGRASFVDGLRDVVLREEHHFLKVLECDCLILLEDGLKCLGVCVNFDT